MGDWNLTKELRKQLDHIGMDYAEGIYDQNSGIIRCSESVTTVWPVHDEPCVALRFMEGLHGFECINNDLTPRMAVMMATMSALDWHKSDNEEGDLK